MKTITKMEKQILIIMVLLLIATQRKKTTTSMEIPKNSKIERSRFIT